jgi:hypothetical protein
MLRKVESTLIDPTLLNRKAPTPEVRKYLSEIGKLGPRRKTQKQMAAWKRNAELAWRARWKDRPSAQRPLPDWAKGTDPSKE